MKLTASTSAFNQQDFRETLSYFPTGVAVATMMTAEQSPKGLTISSFNTVSISPPLILWSIDLASTNIKDFQTTEFFAVNILASDQIELCKYFASPKMNQFDPIDWHLSEQNLPILNHVAAILECRTWRIYEGGDHDIIIGEVLTYNHTDKQPLVFGKGQFAEFPH